MASLRVFLLVIWISCSRSQTTECQSQYGGYCRGLFGASCKPGELESLGHCGFLSFCCLPDPSTVNSPQTTTPQPAHGDCGTTETNRIVGGNFTTIAEVPWQVAMRYHGNLECGASLIDQQWILTAAHCFDESFQSGWTVSLGMSKRSDISEANTYPIESVFRHTDYNNYTMANDIALIKLAKKIDISGHNVRPICLPAKGDNFVNSVCTASGWGVEVHDKNVIPDTLKKVRLPIVDNALCKYYITNVIYDHNLCAGYPRGGSDACQGDSGGPLACKQGDVWKLAGVTSWGDGCAERGSPGVYIRVSSFLDWIDHVMKTYS